MTSPPLTQNNTREFSYAISIPTVPLTENELNADNNEPSQLLDIEGVEHPAQEAHQVMPPSYPPLPSSHFYPTHDTANVLGPFPEPTHLQLPMIPSSLPMPTAIDTLPPLNMPTLDPQVLQSYGHQQNPDTIEAIYPSQPTKRFRTLEEDRDERKQRHSACEHRRRQNMAQSMENLKDLLSCPPQMSQVNVLDKATSAILALNDNLKTIYNDVSLVKQISITAQQAGVDCSDFIQMVNRAQKSAKDAVSRLNLPKEVADAIDDGEQFQEEQPFPQLPLPETEGIMPNSSQFNPLNQNLPVPSLQIGET